MKFEERYSIGKYVSRGKFGKVYDVYGKLQQISCMINDEARAVSHRQMLKNEFDLYEKI